MVLTRESRSRRVSSLGFLWTVKTSGDLAANVAFVVPSICGLWDCGHLFGLWDS